MVLSGTLVSPLRYGPDRSAMTLTRFPRVRLAHLPTPLEHLPRLSEHLAGPQIYVKRDDCTGLATGGNKTRKLEYLVADAIEHGADTLITLGAVQSNHARQTAAAAARFGLGCELLFERRIDHPAHDYLHSGNVLLDRIFGANIHDFDRGTDMDAAAEAVADEMRAHGKTPYVIPGGGSNPIGALGYVGCALELAEQADVADIEIGHVIHASGSAGTQAGLAVGLALADLDASLIGISVSASREQLEDKVWALTQPTAELVGRPDCVARDDIVADDGYVGEGYGIPTDAMNEAVLLLARLEGLLVDPVYTGKALAGLIDLVRRGSFDPGDQIVFVHTGGVAGLFGYSTQVRT
jgi:L-cysteate sulfo-lyase